MEGQAAVLVAAGGAVGVVDQEELDGVGGGLPHGRLVERKVADAVGLGGALGVGFEEGVDDVLGGLEGAGGVEGEVAPVVDSGGFFGELGRLRPGWDGKLAKRTYIPRTSADEKISTSTVENSNVPWHG